MNPVVHFEMPYDHRERLATFDASAFGWEMQTLGEDMGQYVLATTTETDQTGPTRPGAINGGFFPKKPDWPAPYPSIVIAVDDIQQAVKTVTDAGGKVLGEPMEDARRRAVRLVHRHGGQPREYAATNPT